MKSRARFATLDFRVRSGRRHGRSTAMAPCASWQIFSYGTLCVMADQQLWHPVRHGSSTAMAPCASWQINSYGTLCVMADLQLWHPVRHGISTSMVPCVSWQIYSYGIMCVPTPNRNQFSCLESLVKSDSPLNLSLNTNQSHTVAHNKQPHTHSSSQQTTHTHTVAHNKQPHTHTVAHNKRPHTHTHTQ